MASKASQQWHRRELIVVLVMTAIGGIIRLWSPGKLGLVHFDEGIYALSGLWPISPKGFWGIDPTVIAYAPGGYPFLVGVGSFALEVGDLTPILVSILMGTFTIPAAAWLSWRTFGPTAGAITATFAAFSGFHIAFSRMALTDASFLFFFILALGMGQRFLERPNLLNTIGLGIGVGLLQWFKYHGWLVGAIVALTAFVSALLDPVERQPRRLATVWGQGACAGLIAFAVFWPWFSFVQSHGGYASLLRHHASYMQGPRSWYLNWITQLDENEALNDARVVLLGLPLTIMIFPNLGWWVGGFQTLPILRSGGCSSRLLALGWLVFSALTPIYYPYARLWLPLEGLGWILLGGFGSWIYASLRPSTVDAGSWQSAHPFSKQWGIVLVLILAAAVARSLPSYKVDAIPRNVVSSGSDSLRTACRQVQGDLPKSLVRLRFLGRPPITFYLATAGVPLAPQPDLSTLLKPGSLTDWALVDDALLRQEPNYAKAKARLTEGWDLVREYPTTLNLPTLLDLNPGAASGKIEPAAFECPLWLLRPRSKGTP